MIRCCVALAFALTLPVLGGLAAPQRDGQILEVVGNKDDDGLNVWQHKGKASPAKADLGKAEGRLVVTVKNGDTVWFRNEAGGGSHGVIFEQAKAEMDAGVWSVVDGPADLQAIDATYKGYDPTSAMTTKPVPQGQPIIRIKVETLQPGDDHGILFACDPHSKGGSTPRRSMLGVIVLVENDDAKSENGE